VKYLLDSKPEREAARQRALLGALERKYAPIVRGEIGRASDMMAMTYAATGNAPTLVDNHQIELKRLFEEMTGAAITAFGGRIVNQGKSMGLILEVKSFAEFFQRLVLQYINLESMRRRITFISETTRNDIVAEIVRGQSEGLGVEAIARLINLRIPVISRRRGALIARTETHGAANFGADQAARSTGLDMRKRWIAVEDPRTRDFGEGDGVVDAFNHRSMDGQIVDMDQPFKMPSRRFGTLDAMFPGDPELPAGATINCRCAIAHTVKGFED